jgi:uncharacterized protein YybS (DUF2232 family)
MAGPEPAGRGVRALSATPALLIAAAFFLPVGVPSLFGWMNGLLAVPVFLLLWKTDNDHQAGLHLRNGLIVAGAGALLLNKLLLIVFSLTMIPPAYSLYRSARRGDDPATAGAKGAITLALSWFVFWAVYGIIAGTNPYAGLLGMLDKSFGAIMELYRGNAELPADVAYNLEQIIGSIRAYLPRVLPGLLAGSVILTIWFNQVIANMLATRLWPEKPPWPKYAAWQLPDKLVWLVIAAAVLSLVGRGTVQDSGYCLAIVAALLYFFQGTTIFAHLLDRWRVPQYLRLILYVILAIQSFGLILLAVIGLADTWLDFRKLGRKEDTNNDT